MTPSHFFTWPNWTLLGLNIALEGIVFYLAISRKIARKMVMLPVFAGFCLIVDIAGTAIAFITPAAGAGHLWTAHSYWLFYWSAQFIASVIVLLLAVQIVISILPPWNYLIALIGIVAVTCVAVVYQKLLPVQGPRDVLKILTCADAITVLTLPIIWVVDASKWPKGLGLLAAGMVASLVIQAVCALTGAMLKTMVGIVEIGIPFSALVGMGFFLAALLKFKDAPTINGMAPVSGH